MHPALDSLCCKAGTPSFIQPALLCVCVSCVLGGEQVDVSDVTQIWGQLLRFNGSMGRDKQREALEQETWKLSAVGARGSRVALLRDLGKASVSPEVQQELTFEGEFSILLQPRQKQPCV